MVELMVNLYFVMAIILIVIIIIDIILYILLKIKQNKEKQKQKEKIEELQNTIKEVLEEEKESIDEIFQEPENEIESIIYNEKNQLQKVEETRADGNLPYSRKMLLTNYEYKCYKILKPLADKYKIHIMSKVKLIDFITVNRGMTKQECYSYIGKIKQSHVDFVFCNPDNLYPLACLELDDSTHKSLKAQEKDSFKNQVFSSAGIRLYRINNLNVDLEQMIKEISELNK